MKMIRQRSTLSATGLMVAAVIAATWWRWRVEDRALAGRALARLD